MDQQNFALSRVPVNIEDEMKRSYMDYAMSVIIGRALPDVRDGLKPAHRRVLYGMRLMGLSSNRAYRKCAKIVGEVMGNFHPHGDSSIYDTLVRLAQDFNMRYPLVDGQGNFGSVDGDSAAAMRYTEARLKALAEDLMADLDKETVDFVPNYDETTEEPTVLPAQFPNLLVNGSTGIAVGMATNIPPHNLGEIVDALVWLIRQQPSMRDDGLTSTSREDKQREILRLVPGPDFPTGGSIIGQRGIYEAFTTGRGSLTLRAKTEFEDRKGDRTAIVVTEIPYQVNKARLLEKIAELAREKMIEGISDLRDESDRQGMRIVIELKRGEVGQVVLNNLLKQTQLQSTFGVTMLAIVEGRPRVLPLLDMLEYFIEFRRDVVRRRTEFELRKAEARAHILEGFKIALDNIDAVIALIKASPSTAAARAGLMSTFGLSEIQSQAILEMQLQRLTGLERQKILDELAELLRTIERLRAILGSDRLLLDIVVKELEDIRERYADERRTTIEPQDGDFADIDFIKEEDVAITVSSTGYIKRTRLEEYRKQRRGGQGSKGMTVREEDAVAHLFIASTHSYILIFTRGGKCFWLNVYKIPEVSRDAKGTAIVNLVQLGSDRIAALLAVREFPTEDDKQYIVMATRRGVIKKTDLKAYSNPRAAGIIAIGVEDDDQVIDVQLSDGTNHIIFGTKDGKAIRFHEEDARAMGRGAYGVRGISLREGDEVVGMDVLRAPGAILTVTENGYGKRTDSEEYRLQTRGGMGLINIQTSDRNGSVVGIAHVTDDDELMLMTEQGKILRTSVSQIREIGRNSQGVRLIQLQEGDRVVSIARFAERSENGEPVDTEPLAATTEAAPAAPAAEDDSPTEQ